MKRRIVSVGTLLIVCLMSVLVRFFAGSLPIAELVKKVCSVTWNS